MAADAGCTLDVIDPLATQAESDDGENGNPNNEG